MPVVAFTSPFVKHAACPSGQAKIDFFDSAQRGLMLEVRNSGRKTFTKDTLTHAAESISTSSGRPMC